MFGPRNSAYTFLDTTDILTHTHITHIYISHAISIEHPSVGLTLLTQLRSRFHLKPHFFSPSLTNGDKSDELLLQYIYLNMAKLLFHVSVLF